MQSAFVKSVLTAVLLLTSSKSFAQYFTGPMAAGTGGAGRAMIEGSESAFLNPATVAYLQEYTGALHYADGVHPVVGEDQTYGLVLSDGNPERIIPGAISYLRRRISNSTYMANEQYVGVTLAERASQYFSFGVTGHYRSHERKTGPDYYQTNFDLGFVFSPLQNLGFAAVAYNLLSAPDKVTADVADIPTLAIGAHYILLEVFRLRGDLVRPDKYNPGHRINAKAGLETEFQTHFLFRVGGNWEETKDQTWLTGGIGYRGPRLSFNYSYEQDLRVSGGHRHLVDLWMPF